MLRCVIADYAHTVPVDHTPADYFPVSFFFFFNDTATTEIYTLSLHDALPISRFAAVHVRATEGLGVDVLAGRGLHQGRSAEKDPSLVAHDHVLIRHRRHVGAAGGARAVHHPDLRHAERGQRRLVVEDAAEVVAVGEHLILRRQKRPAALHQVHAGEAVCARGPLGAQVVLDCGRGVGGGLGWWGGGGGD